MKADKHAYQAENKPKLESMKVLLVTPKFLLKSSKEKEAKLEEYTVKIRETWYKFLNFFCSLCSYYIADIFLRTKLRENQSLKC